MNAKKQAIWATWVRGELLESLQAKGKLPKPPPTEARRRREEAYHQTAARIFPPEAESAAEAFLEEARQRLQATASSQGQGVQKQQVTKHHESRGGGQTPGSRAQGSGRGEERRAAAAADSRPRHPEKRAALKAEIVKLRQELSEDRAACKQLTTQQDGPARGQQQGEPQPGCGDNP